MTSNDAFNTPLLYDYPRAPPPDRLGAPSPFKIDEGFSEDQTSEAAFEPEPISIDAADDVAPHTDSVRQWLLTQPAELRAAIARELLSSIPTSFLAELVDDAYGRLHFDPIRFLPQEIISNIFEFLDARSLINASLVSKLWRYHASDPHLWRLLFGLEGWSHDREKFRSFDVKYKSLSQFQHPWSARKAARTRPQESSSRGSNSKRYRRNVEAADSTRDGLYSSVQNSSNRMPPGWSDSFGFNDATLIETDDAAIPLARRDSEVDEEMKDAPDEFGADPFDVPLGQGDSLMSPESSASRLHVSTPHLLDSASRLFNTATRNAQPNWHHLYKQRRRLEQNWSAGRFKAFRLPHPDFKDEAHRQCVYSLQFTNKHLVSGSRDKTIRVWDLSTQRLKLPPLAGHQGSVLCLQFDESPQQDVIISGGSDSDVIVWKFSTGAILNRLRGAHKESVLNLRFDHRYLVTCSKDKTIKLWNRKSLKPTDPEYPQTNRSPNAHYPDYIVNVADLVAGKALNALDPYTLLMTFDEHNAAVNAIQIFGNEIVSASGDRKINLWDIGTGTLIRTFLGHTKGIACVQYDGRRIISGSSDNSVRIFDSATTAELAVLDGHENLVRTVQGDFGNLPGDAGLLEAEARESDRRILEKKAQRLQNGNSDAWDEPFVLGAKLPPSGGGNRWSKIVSGSYDETIIIWRKDETGKWFAAKQLRQEDAMRATAPPGEVQQLIQVEAFEASTRSGFVGVRSGPPFAINSAPYHIFQHAQALGMPPHLSTSDGVLWIQRNLLISRTAWGCIQFFRLRFWNLPGNNQTAGQPAGTNAQSPDALATPAPTTDNGIPPNATQLPNSSQAQPAHLHPNHPHYQYHMGPQTLPQDTQAQMPAMPRVNAQLRQPQLQAQLHHRLAQHLIQSTRDVTLEPGPTNIVHNHAGVAPPQAQQEDAAADGQHPQAAAANQRSSEPQETDQTPAQAQPTVRLDSLDQASSQSQPRTNEQQQQQQPPPPAAPQAQTQAIQPAPQPQPQNPQQHFPPHHHHHHHHHHHRHHQQIPANQESGLSRVFKLQFDSRRIICCSQQPIIVGWDFANGDRDIEEASEFFDTPQ